jgi:hypothetical protein
MDHPAIDKFLSRMNAQAGSQSDFDGTAVFIGGLCAVGIIAAFAAAGIIDQDKNKPPAAPQTISAPAQSGPLEPVQK